MLANDPSPGLRRLLTAPSQVTLSPGVCVTTRLGGPAAPQALWSAAARRRFHRASLLASYPLGYCMRTDGQQSRRAESGSKLPHSKAGSARKI
jgi:hypothetical protein